MQILFEKVHDTPTELRLILIEVSTLKTVLENAKFLALCPDDKSLVLESLSSHDGPIQQCHNLLGKLGGLFPQDPAKEAGFSQKKRQKIKHALALLAWPLNAKKAERLLDEIQVCKSTITVALTADISYSVHLDIIYQKDKTVYFSCLLLSPASPRLGWYSC